MNQTFQRAILHIQQGRIDSAENDLRTLLMEDPENGLYLAYLAITLNEQERYPEALETIDAATGYAPDNSFCFFVKADLYYNMNRIKEAEEVIRVALAMDPDNEDYYGLLSQILIRRKRWQEALDAAEEGLAIDPDNVGCNNLRSFALVKLGRREEAGISLDATLMKDPENDITHANKGWANLHEGKPKEALHHFREALRINPRNEYARQGIIEALKARNILYRPILSYFLWMSRLSGKAQWGVILGLYFGSRFIRTVGKMSPEIQPIATILMILYAVFVYFSWTANPLFNLMLSLDSYGRHALRPDEKLQARWVGTFFLGGLALLGVSFLAKMSLLLILGIISLLLVIPIAGTLARQGKSRAILVGYTALLGAAGYGAVLLTGSNSDTAGSLYMIFLFGLIAFQFIANFISIRE